MNATTAMLILLVTGVWLAPPDDRASESKPAETQPNPAADDAAASAQVDSRVEVVLDELESAGQAVDSIKCDVAFKETDRLNLTDMAKKGSIRFKRTDPHPMFHIQFDLLEIDGIVHRDRESWLFRDRWLTELKSKSKTIIRREIVAAGEEVDFFDLENSPFPIPFGQRKKQILDNFDVTLAPAQMGDPPECDHLVCRPKQKAPLGRDFKRLDFYVSRELHLPLRIIAEDAKGEKVTIADFPDLGASAINAQIADDAFTLSEDDTRGYAVSIEPLQE
jgi:hypothetical protein